MSCIGIITNPKNEEYIKEILYKYFDISQVIFITDKNIKKVSKTKFETIIIDSSVNNEMDFKKIVSNTKYIILNSDISTKIDILGNMNLIVISYGFNSKSTFTVSSVSENNVIICLQRIMSDVLGNKYEPQEIVIKKDENTNIYATIGIEIILLLYQKIGKIQN